MSLFKNLLATYDKCENVAGIPQREADGTVNEKKTFLPIFHTTFKSHICITLDSEGNFIKFEKDKKETTIIIPCTDKSAGRSSGIAAHPLCDTLDYVSGITKNKTDAYLAELGNWKEENPKLKAIYDYIEKGAIVENLELNPKENWEKTRKLGVRFAVYIDNEKTSNVWEDNEIRQAWIDYIKPHGNFECFDYLSGEQVNKISEQHPKNINSKTGNAKLLSCNDTSGFTFRGRFDKQDEAVIVDYEQSQKMHQALRWLINNYGYNIDSQTIIAWAVDSDTRAPADLQKDSFNLFSSMPIIKGDSEALAEAAKEVGADYSRKLRSLFQGLSSAEKIKKYSRKICIAVFDAATTGRMGLTFYRELSEGEYLESIIMWHEEASYYLTSFIKSKDSKGKDKFTPINYIGAPSYDDILFAVYGKARGNNDSGYSTLKKKVRKQLLECMFGNFSFPKSMVDMATARASRPMAFDSESDHERSVSITCALARKFYKQQKEEIKLALDKTRKDRDYLYGRLLAVADNLESHALRKAGVKDRTTNAMRLMSAFAVKPYQTWGILHKQLHPYINQLGGAGYYQSIIDEILISFKDGEYENNEQLSPLYLLGFSAQRRAILEKNKEKTEEKHNESTD